MSGFTEGNYQAVLRNLHRPKINADQEDLELFLLDFYPYDESRLRRIYPDLDEDDEDQEPQFDYDGKLIHKIRKRKSNNFRVRVFGTLERIENGEKKYYSISIDLLKYKPFFFVKIPNHWKFRQLEEFIENLKHEARQDIEARFPYFSTLIKHQSIQAKPLYGFTAEDQFQYVKLIFENSSGFNNYRNLIGRLNKYSPAYWKKHQLFESNIEPMLRLNHIQEITPSGWIKIPRGQAHVSEKDTSDCQLHYEIDYTKIESLPNKTSIPPMICASFDIEADSSHGDFPIANKSYQKLSQDIVTSYLKLPNKNQYYLRTIIYRWLTLAFNPYFDNNNINRIITKNGIKPNPNRVIYLAQKVYELGEQYRSSLQDIIREGYDPASFRDGILDRYATQLHLLLELNLPEINLEKVGTGNYQLLAQQLLREVNRMVSCHKKFFLDQPFKCIQFWINLAFDDHYDNHEINRVYTKDNNHPSPSILRNLVPQIFQICQECYLELNKPKEKKKPVPKIGPKKCMLEPPPKGQTRLSQSSFMKRKSAKITKLKKEQTNQKNQQNNNQQNNNQQNNNQQNNNQQNNNQQNNNQTDQSEKKKNSKVEHKSNNNYNNNYNNNQQQQQFYRGRYIKTKPEPDPEDPLQKIPKIGRDFFVTWIHELFDQFLPDIIGDPVIQIGTTFKQYGQKELFLKHIITLKGCSKFTNAQLINDENLDIFITKPKDAIDEAKKLKLETPLIDQIQLRLNQAAQKAIKNPEIPELKELNHLIYIARKNNQLNNDNSVVKVECYDTEQEVLLAWRRLIKETDPDVLIGYNIFGFDFKYLWDRAEVLGVLDEFRDIGRIKLYPERLVEKKLVSSGLGDNLLYYIPMTGRILVDLLKVVQSGGYRLPIYKLDYVCNHFLYKRKNDLSPQKIFIYQKGSDQDRATIARYCLIDCILCNRLIDKLDILTNNIGMSRVCSVPLSYLFLRGQGIKIFSFLSKICRKENYLIKTKDRDDAKDQEGYEGAIVLEPEKGIYFEASVVADFNSLYPSCMIAWNLSHDSYIEIGGKYDNLPEDQYYDVQYDLYRMEDIPGRIAQQKVKYGIKTCRYYQPPDGSKSLVPRVLESLLKARKQTRKEQKTFPKGTFEWNVKEGLQLAYKVTANSVYGQIGAPTSAIFLKDIAACTTACGRGLIYSSKDFFEDHYAGSKTIYGDSVTGDTPILVRNEKQMVEVRTIETLVGHDQWKSYDEFKLGQSNRIEKQQAIVNLETWTKNGWAKIKRVIRHQTNKKIFRINTSSGCLDVTEDHSLLKLNGEIIQPIDCQIGTKLLHGFPILFNNPSPSQNNQNIYHTDSKINAQFIYCNLKFHHPNNHIEISFNPKHNKYTIILHMKHKLTETNQIKQIITINSHTSSLVYDLETEDGTFQAGIGSIIAKNTDSVFIKFNTINIRRERLHGLDSIYKSIELCMEGSLGISRTLPRPHNLEFEKAIWPFMLLSKKRYHGHYYTIYGKPKFYPNSMGIVLKRRDNAQIVKHIFGGVIDIIMEEHDIKKAMKYCQQESKKLLEGKFPMKYFTITKTLKSYYKNPDQIAHNVLAQRIAERDPGNKPQSNDRMAFAYIKVPEPKKGEKVLQGHRIETPEYIEDQNLPLDYRFYLTNQVMKPLLQIFDLVMDEKQLGGLFTEALMEYDRKISGSQRITKWVNPNSNEYKKRIDIIINDLLKKIEKEESSDAPVKINAGDEIL